jgi:hypothetical protein
LSRSQREGALDKLQQVIDIHIGGPLCRDAEVSCPSVIGIYDLRLGYKTPLFQTTGYELVVRLKHDRWEEEYGSFAW